MNLPYTGWPSDRLPHLADIILTLAEHDEVYNFKIGRTNDTTIRKRDYAARYDPAPTDLLAIYETDSVPHALEVEEELIQLFIDHDKCLNEADHAGGGVSPRYRQYVYVAVWMAT